MTSEASASVRDSLHCAPESASRADDDAPSFEESPLCCFFKRLRNWIEFTSEETECFIRAASRAVSHKAGDMFSVSDQGRQPLAIVQNGAAASFTILPNGERHISSVFYPGDLVTYQNFQTGRAVHEIMMIADGELAFIDDRRFAHELDRRSHIAQIVMLTETARTLFVSDRFASAIRLQAHERLLYLLLELKALEELTSDKAFDETTLILTQEQMGDMIGLTPVTISKSLSRLAERGVVHRGKKLARFANRSASELSVGFINRFRQVKSWKRTRPGELKPGT